MSRLKKFILNGFLLTTVSLIMRTVSLSFNVYVTNRVGAESIGLYSLLSTVYGFALTLATSGINLAVTRLVAEASTRGGTVRLSMRKAVSYCLAFGTLSASLLFIFSEFIGTNWLNDTRTITSLRLLALSLPFVSLSSALSGYFSAVRRVWKNAAVQIIEQALKIILISRFLTLFMPSGIEFACIALVLGGVIAEFLSFCISFISYLSDLKYYINRDKPTESAHTVKRKLVSISLPVAFSTYVRSGLVTLEHILIPSSLRRRGLSHDEALATYGAVHSMALPVVLFPASFIASFSGLLIPEIAENASVGKKNNTKYITSRVFKLTLIFSFGISGIMLSFSHELGNLIYSDSSAAHYIRLLAPIIPIMYLDTVTDSILKGLGFQVYTMNVNIADALLSVVLVSVLIPSFGIIGYIITIYISEIINAAFSITKLLNVTGAKSHLLHWILFPLISVCGATCIVRLIFYFSPIPVSGILSLSAKIVLSLIIYFVLLTATDTLGAEDRKWIRGIFKDK